MWCMTYAVEYMHHHSICDSISWLQPGQFIKVCNLHAAIFKDSEQRPELSELETLELCVHKGTSYGRGVFILNEDIPPVVKLKEKLESLAPPSPVKRKATNEGNTSDAGVPQPECSNSKKARVESTNSVTCDLSHDKENQSNERGRSHGQVDQSESRNRSNMIDSQDITSRCMLQTVTGKVIPQ